MLSQSEPFREKLKERYRTAPLDLASFHRLYKVCGKDECGGACCFGGACFYLPEEHEQVKKLVAEKADHFTKNGIDLNVQLFDSELDEDTGETIISTNTVPYQYAKGVPEDYTHTACAFRQPNTACSLQTLGLAEGKPGWWYKPFACWLFPIQLDDVDHGPERPFIHVVHPSTDEFAEGGEGFILCGTECKTGKPAYEVLKGEIAALSELLDRDMLSEILAYKAEKIA